VFLFSDVDIRKAMEDYHIRKAQDDENVEIQIEEDDIQCHLKDWNDEATSCSIDSSMNSDTMDQEVKSTFGKGTNAAGPDSISASMIDKSVRELMYKCLGILWNRS